MSVRDLARFAVWLLLGVLPAAIFWAVLDPRSGLDTGMPALALAALCAWQARREQEWWGRARLFWFGAALTCAGQAGESLGSGAFVAAAMAMVLLVSGGIHPKAAR